MVNTEVYFKPVRCHFASGWRNTDACIINQDVDLRKILLHFRRKLVNGSDASQVQFHGNLGKTYMLTFLCRKVMALLLLTEY